MYLLRFPNSGIRAKAARRTDGQPRPAPIQGRPPTAMPAVAKPPCKGAVDHDQSPLQGQPSACATARGRGWRLQGRRLWV
ncbi:hypothetical protein GW17_00061745 [Ensete ventricosum]|nr:hypothetical protein GW17_00061745 [Ensete ventricosum]RZR82788.1 hypothetical protein BHM03_00009273 [Ensete ventricosum]